MWGSKDYWALVIKFYTEVLKVKDFKLERLNGMALNALQVPFLILRLKMHLNGQEKEYGSSVFFNRLPETLNAVAPEIQPIFLAAITNGNMSLSDGQKTQLKSIIETSIINKILEFEAPATIPKVPLINYFNCDKTQITSGDELTLSWEVENAERLELFRNDGLLKEISPETSSLTFKQFADGPRELFFYQLLAYKELVVTKSPVIELRLKESQKVSQIHHRKRRSPMLLIGVLVALAALGALAYYIFFMNESPPGITQTVLRQGIDTTITIYGKTIRSGDVSIVLFNGNAGKTVAVNDGSLIAALPLDNLNPAGEDSIVKLQVMSSGKYTEAGTFEYLPRLQIKQRQVVENKTLMIYGKKLDRGIINVFIGDHEVTLVSSNSDSLVVTVPELEGYTNGSKMDLLVKQDGNNIFSVPAYVGLDTLRLLKMVTSAKWMEGYMEGNNDAQTDIGALPYPGNFSDTRGYASLVNTTTEDAVAREALWTHPRWSPQGSIKGIFPLKGVSGKRVFQSAVGFIHQSNSPDGVIFKVFVQDPRMGTNSRTLLKSIAKNYDGALAQLSADIPETLPDYFYLELEVATGATADSDWAAWVEPMVISRKLVLRPPFIRPRITNQLKVKPNAAQVLTK